jgi:four helix bundle protein
MDLGERLYRATWTFPRNESYGLAGQIQRAAVSIPSNIAEGHTRESTKVYLNFLSVARSSLAEARTQVAFATRLGYLAASDADSLEREAVVLARQLTALRNALRRRV